MGTAIKLSTQTTAHQPATQEGHPKLVPPHKRGRKHGATFGASPRFVATFSLDPRIVPVVDLRGKNRSGIISDMLHDTIDLFDQCHIRDRFSSEEIEALANALDATDFPKFSVRHRVNKELFLKETLGSAKPEWGISAPTAGKIKKLDKVSCYALIDTLRQVLNARSPKTPVKKPDLTKYQLEN